MLQAAVISLVCLPAQGPTLESIGGLILKMPNHKLPTKGDAPFTLTLSNEMQDQIIIMRFNLGIGFPQLHTLSLNPLKSLWPDAAPTLTYFRVSIHISC
ncbi:hypothetical protein BDR05DRAFT_157031 [Suillus weaverae]|nr:hypothetical protein BDR05DRAFT_157031 [Suillus weaverae]